MAEAKPIYHAVPGSPFQPGDRVRVASASDQTARLIGASGVVEYLEYSCGCGQVYPTDPMIGVLLASGEREEYWAEELRRMPK